MKKIIRTLEKTRLQLSSDEVELLLKNGQIYAGDKKISSYNEFVQKKSYTIKVDDNDLFLAVVNGRTEFSKREENSSIFVTAEVDPSCLLLKVRIEKNGEKEENFILNFSTMSEENFKKYYGYYLLTETCKKILKKEIDELVEQEKNEKKLREDKLNILSSELSLDHSLAEIKVERKEKDKLKDLLREVKSEENTLRKFSSDLKIP